MQPIWRGLVCGILLLNGCASESLPLTEGFHTELPPPHTIALIWGSHPTVVAAATTWLLQQGLRRGDGRGLLGCGFWLGLALQAHLTSLALLPGAIAFFCSYEGYTANVGAEGVGRSTAQAVVVTSVAILVLDAVIAILLAPYLQA